MTTINARLAAAELAARRADADYRAALARRPITTEAELCALLVEAVTPEAQAALYSTLWDRMTPEVADAFEEAIRAECARRGEPVDW